MTTPPETLGLVTPAQPAAPSRDGVRRPRGWRTWVPASDRMVVAGLVFAALLLRLPNLGRSYWVDEGISVGIASHPVWQIPGLLRRDGSPPLFYIVLHFWLRLFGSSEVATHLLPLGISLLAVPVGYWAGRRLFGRRAGILAAALLATNPFLGWYSTETRMYPMVVVVSMVAVAKAWQAFEGRRLSDASVAVVAFAILLYTHNWGVYLVVATAAVLFGRAWSDGDRPLAGQVALAAAAVGALWLPWAPVFAYQAANTAAPWAVSPKIGDFFADPASTLGGTLGFAVAPLLGLGAMWCSQYLDRTGRRRVAALALIPLFATAAGFAGAQVNPSWTVRYLAVVIGPYLLAAAGALAAGSTSGRRVAVVACSALAGWSVLGSVLPNPNARSAKSNVAALGRAVGPILRPGDLVVVTQTEQTPALYHYLPRGLRYATPTGPVADPRVVDWRHIVDRLDSAVPCRAVAPSLDALPVGAHVLEVNPARYLGASGSAWSRAVNGQVSAVTQLLGSDPALAYAGTFDPALSPRPFSPVDGVLFVKIRLTTACR